MREFSEKFDVAVIGGGPAGMLAAGRAAELGAKVVLLEKNLSLGKKLLITGKGRCNLTQAEFDDQKFIERIGKKGKFLFSPLATFGPEETIEFFEKRQVPTKTERGGRVFPVSDQASDVLRALNDYLQKGKVRLFLGAEVLGLEKSGNKIKKIKLKGTSGVISSQRILAEKFILCTGGKSYPVTGSTGDGYAWAESLGHKIIPPRPALVPIKLRESWASDLQGLSLKNVALSLQEKNKKRVVGFGEMLFTHFGFSGPIVLDASKKIGEELQKGLVQMTLDLKPALSEKQLDDRLQRDFQVSGNKDFINYLPDLLPKKMVEVFIRLSEIDPRKKMKLITREERKRMLSLLKELPLTAESLLGYDQAIVTSGGVDLGQVDSKTMQSRLIDNLYLAGEVLDLDGPTGGYNLQIAWTTGFVAGGCGRK